MNIFNLFNNKEKRNQEEQVQYSTLSDALLFGNIYNRFQSMNLSAVFRATEIISDGVAMLPINIKFKNDKDNNVFNEHPLNYVFDNGLIDKYTFMKMLIQQVIIKGNGFAHIERGADGTVTKLRFLDANDVQVIYDKVKQTLYYQVPIISAKKIEPCNMIHLKKNSWDGINGVSILSYAARTLGIASDAENATSNFFKSGCNLSGVLTVDGQLSATQREQIKNTWAQTYVEGGNGIAVLQGNMHYQPIQMSSKDSQLLESRIYNVQDIARFFGISPVLLGDLSHTSYNTIEAIQQDFLTHTLQPYITMVEREFNRKLLKPSEQANLYIDLDETYLLKSDKTATAGYYSSLINNGVLSVNEVRKELGYSEVEGLDKHIIAYTDINQNTIENNNEQGIKADSTK